MMQLLSVSIFSFCFVTTVPSWVNEKRPDVDARRVIWIATRECTCVAPRGSRGLIPVLRACSH